MTVVLTVLPRLLNKSVNATFSIVPLGGHRGDVIPAHRLHNVHHGLGLVRVRWHHSREEIVAGVVAELWSGGGITHLRYLHGNKYRRRLMHGHTKDFQKMGFCAVSGALQKPEA